MYVTMYVTMHVTTSLLRATFCTSNARVRTKFYYEVSSVSRSTLLVRTKLYEVSYEARAHAPRSLVAHARERAEQRAVPLRSATRASRGAALSRCAATAGSAPPAGPCPAYEFSYEFARSNSAADYSFSYTKYEISNTKYTSDTGQTRNKLLEQWVHLTNHTAGHERASYNIFGAFFAAGRAV